MLYLNVLRFSLKCFLREILFLSLSLYFSFLNKKMR